MRIQAKNTADNCSLRVLKVGSLCKASIPTLEGKLAIGVVQSFQVLYYKNNDPYVMAWVEMLIDGHKRPFELQQLEVLPRAINGNDQALIIELMKEAA